MLTRRVPIPELVVYPNDSRKILALYAQTRRRIVNHTKSSGGRNRSRPTPKPHWKRCLERYVTIWRIKSPQRGIRSNSILIPAVKRTKGFDIKTRLDAHHGLHCQVRCHPDNNAARTYSPSAHSNRSSVFPLQLLTCPESNTIVYIPHQPIQTVQVYFLCTLLTHPESNTIHA